MSVAADLVARVEARGVRLSVEDGHLVASPSGVLTPEERAALAASKPEVVEALRERGRRALYRLDRTLVLDVPGLGAPVLIAPSCAEAARIRATEPRPSVVLCVCRLLDLLIVGATQREARGVLEALLLFDGEILQVNPTPDRVQ